MRLRADFRFLLDASLKGADAAGLRLGHNLRLLLMEPGSGRPERSSEQRRSFCGLRGAEKPGQDGGSAQSADKTPEAINRISETKVGTLPAHRASPGPLLVGE